MLNKLELEITEVEKRIGDKMVSTDADSRMPTLVDWGGFEWKFAAKGFSKGFCLRLIAEACHTTGWVL